MAVLTSVVYSNTPCVYVCMYANLRFVDTIIMQCCVIEHKLFPVMGQRKIGFGSVCARVRVMQFRDVEERKCQILLTRSIAP
jgi:hypothetical protein